MMKSFAFSAALWLRMSSIRAYSVPNGNIGTATGTLASRRSALGSMLATTAAALLVSNHEAAAAASVATPSLGTDVYFGVGCFWHIQHEFVEAEREILGRGDTELSARTGYAGGTKVDTKEGAPRVCYHNSNNIADYGRLGHGEVVGLTIPEASIGDFAKVYFSLYNPKTNDRVDSMDKGAEYRSLLGLPGGLNHPMYPDVEAAALAAGFKLQPGKGNDPDTLGKQIVYVMDSNEFPFHQAEVYHQYHDDFLSPAYGRKYNSLVDLALEDGRVKGTGCPDRI